MPSPIDSIPRSRAARLRRHTVALARAARDILDSDEGSLKAFSILAPAAMEAMGVQRLSLWQRNGEANLVCRQAAPGPDAFIGRHRVLAVPRAMAGNRRRHAADQRVLRMDVEQLADASWYDLLALHETAAYLDARVQVDGHYWGQLCFESAPRRVWHADEAALAGYFADVLGIAIGRERRRQAEAKLAYLQWYDDTSGLANRSLFNACVAERLKRIGQRPALAALLFVDIDRFHALNEALGEGGGNRALAVLADRINAATPDDAMLGRLEGDCFGILLPRIEHEWIAHMHAQAVLAAVAAPLEVGAQTLDITASAGIAFATAAGPSNAEEWLRNADLASKQAKANGRQVVEVFNPEGHQRLVERIAIERGLRDALKHDGIEVAFQPEFDLGTGLVTGAEALARWRRADGELVTAGEFIEVAEASGLIEAIGLIVLQTACTQACAWPDAADGVARMVRVNLSARQFESSHLVELVAECLRTSHLTPQRLCLEITESELMSRAQASLQTLDGLHALGVKLAMDDFGTGYSSLSYLRRFPLDTLKLDKSLVDGLPGNHVGCAVVEAVYGMGTALGLELVAEGVEHAEQGEYLRRLGIRRVQGFFYARPEPIDAFNARLAAADQAGAPA